MGRSYLFECSRCGYRAKVSGGADAGKGVEVLTVVCRECNQLYDAVTRMRINDDSPLASWKQEGKLKGLKPIGRRRSTEAPPTLQAALNRLPLQNTRRARWVPYKARCLVSPTHAVRSWSYPGKCPKCGVFMDKSALPFRAWD